MIKPLATMIFILGAIMLTVTFFNFLNNPSFIDYNGGLKFSMSDTGMSLSFLISIFLTISGFVLLKVSKVPRDV